MRHLCVCLLVLVCVTCGMWWLLSRRPAASVSRAPASAHATTGKELAASSVASAHSGTARPQEVVFRLPPSESEDRAALYRKERSGSLVPRIAVARTAKAHTALLLDACGSEGVGLTYTWEITRPDGTVDLVVSQVPVTNYVVGSTGVVRGVLLLSDKLHRVKPANFDLVVTP